MNGYYSTAESLITVLKEFQKEIKKDTKLCKKILHEAGIIDEYGKLTKGYGGLLDDN